MIQDLVFSVGTVALAVALIPMVLATEKPPLKSSLLTGGTLFTFGVCYGSLHLPFACITTFISSALWITLAIQKARQYE